MATLRNKTREKLEEDKCRILEGVIEDFLKKDGPDAEEAIWKLCYQPETELMWMGFPMETYSQEDAIVIQSELASQYRTEHKEWQYGCLYENHEKAKGEAAKKLREALGNKFAFDRVMERLLEFSERDIYVVEKILRCLKSKQANSRYGGLKAQRYESFEAQYLLPHAILMGEVFESLVSEKIKERDIEGSKKGRILYAAPHVEMAKKEEAELKEVEQEEKGWSPIELIQYRKEIEDFYKALEIISQIPKAQWLSEHEVQVKQFFIQCDRF